MTANKILLMFDIDDTSLLKHQKLSNCERDFLKTIRDRLNQSKKVADQQVTLSHKILKLAN
ncbi:hypothetical protein Sps_01443 [Shewanella psychrophila]|uniref:Uncharacterized protein n=1 Tax=Shewanella psychrophila TaxID=225848 RepID=A0A1S6HM83_9GAMM|nr:hypothetical protein Sps_01443 [Shewanella psychrophila]